jgi:small subunit ribosomal protein S10
MDVQLDSIKDLADEKWKLLGLKEGSATAEKVMELINREDFRAASGTMAPMAEKRPK